MMTDLSLYVHIPFCVSKCRYCDFLSFPADKAARDAYMEALHEEIRKRSCLCIGKRVISIYIGGGTPSSMEAGVIGQLLVWLQDSFEVDEDAEISIEVNPGTVTPDGLAEYAGSGINRLSIGLQSALDRELKLLGRIHTWEDFLRTYEYARAAGFTNINIDLISALPGQSAEDYRSSLQKVTALNPEHISAYSLQLEEGTYFFRHRDEYHWPDEDLDRELYHMTGHFLKESGYIRYEISNYSKPGYQCRHNCVYWTRGEYLGLGLGAASLLNEVRSSNTRNMTDYLNGRIEGEEEHLELRDRMSEYMFLGLRLTEGINPVRFEETFGVPLEDIYGSAIGKLKREGLLTDEGNIKLTEFGMDVSNYCFTEFLPD